MKKSTLLFVIIPHQELLTDDGIRINADITTMQRYTEIAIELLRQNNIPFHVISVLDRQERIQQVLDIIKSKYPDVLLKLS